MSPLTIIAEFLFWEIIDENDLNDFGLIAFKEWQRTPIIRPNMELGVFVIMPDHIHGIIIITEDVSGWIDSNFSDRFQFRADAIRPEPKYRLGRMHRPNQKIVNQVDTPQSEIVNRGGFATIRR